MKRPPESMSMSSADSAVTQGLRTNASAIDVPSFTLDVDVAAAASGRNGSCDISAAHSVSKPASSACRASRAISSAGAMPTPSE